MGHSSEEGGIRMAVDYREVNGRWHSEPTSIPADAIPKIGGHKYFDSLWGYHQLRLEKKSCKVTAIITPWGVYRFLDCLFGISTAPGKFQAKIAHEILQDCYVNGAVAMAETKKRS